MFRRSVAADIEIRQFALEEAETVFGVVQRNREYLRTWLPWVDQTSSPDDVRAFIAGSIEQHDAGHGPNCGIWLDGAFIGSIGCHSWQPDDRNCCIGYWIEAGRQGRGTVTRCCIQLLDYLFREAKLHRVGIRCAPGNARSRAIPQRLGFTFEGLALEAQRLADRWVDLEIWSMLEQDWRKPS
jgi:ribosomal-protein-serine acetyltransferase